MQNTSAEPKPGPFPALVYDFDPGTGTHSVKCKCGAHCETNEPLVARRFAQTEIGKHARNRIFDPAPDPEP